MTTDTAAQLAILADALSMLSAGPQTLRREGVTWLFRAGRAARRCLTPG